MYVLRVHEERKISYAREVREVMEPCLVASLETNLDLCSLWAEQKLPASAKNPVRVGGSNARCETFHQVCAC